VSIPSFLVSLKSDGAPRLLHTSATYQKASKEGIQFFIRGDLWSFEDSVFSPLHPHREEILLDYFLKDPTHFWNKARGDFSAIVIAPDFVEAYRSPFSPHLLFFQKDLLGDSLVDIVKQNPDSLEFSEQYLKDYVMDVPSLQFGLQATPFSDIQRLPPHTRLVLRALRPPELIFLEQNPFTVVDRELSLEEAGLQFRNKLGEVLNWHLEKTGPLAAELSGGLDSSFVASFIADLKPDALEAHMYSYRKHPSHLFSEKCANQVAREKNIALRVIDSDQAETTLLENHQVYQNEPVDFFWQGALFGKLIQGFLRPKCLLFTGFGCDQLVMRNVSILTFIRKKKGFFSGLKFVRTFAKASKRSMLNFSYQYLLTLLPTSWLISLVDFTRSWKINPFKVDELVPEAGRWERIHWIKSENRGLSGLNLFLIRQKGSDFQKRYFDPLLPQPNLNYLVAPHYVLGPYLEEKEIAYIHPFCDSRLIEFAFTQLPFSLIHDFDSPYKNLLREAMKGITPEKVRNRSQDEFSFDGYYYRFLQINEGFFRQLLEEALPQNNSWVDPVLFRKSFESMLFGGYSQSEVAVSRFISYLFWKRQFLRCLQNS